MATRLTLEFNNNSEAVVFLSMSFFIDQKSEIDEHIVDQLDQLKEDETRVNYVKGNQIFGNCRSTEDAFFKNLELSKKDFVPDDLHGRYGYAEYWKKVGEIYRIKWKGGTNVRFQTITILSLWGPTLRADETKNAIHVQRRKFNGIDVSYEKLKISFFTVMKP